MTDQRRANVDHPDWRAGRREAHRPAGVPVSLPTDLADLAEVRAKLQGRLATVMVAIQAEVLRRLAAGEPEAALARQAGVDRMTVRTWAGKGRHKKQITTTPRYGPDEKIWPSRLTAYTLGETVWLFTPDGVTDSDLLLPAIVRGVTQHQVRPSMGSPPLEALEYEVEIDTAAPPPYAAPPQWSGTHHARHHWLRPREVATDA